MMDTVLKIVGSFDRIAAALERMATAEELKLETYREMKARAAEPSVEDDPRAALEAQGVDVQGTIDRVKTLVKDAVAQEDNRDALLAEAAKLGLEIPPRTRATTIRKMIEDAAKTMTSRGIAVQPVVEQAPVEAEPPGVVAMNATHMTQPEVEQTPLDKFKAAYKSFDYWYSFSDDQRVFDRGTGQRNDLWRQYRALSDTDKDAAKAFALTVVPQREIEGKKILSFDGAYFETEDLPKPEVEQAPEIKIEDFRQAIATLAVAKGKPAVRALFDKHAPGAATATEVFGRGQDVVRAIMAEAK